MREEKENQQKKLLSDDPNDFRVLHMNIDNVNCGGAYQLVRSIEPFARKSGYIFDYLSMDSFIDREDSSFPYGTRLYSGRLRKNRVLGHIRLVQFVFKTLSANSYGIVHIHSDSSWKALLYAMPARFAGYCSVIVHAHSTGIDGDAKALKRVFHLICKSLLDRCTDKKIACVGDAANWMFSRKGIESVQVIENGIAVERFRFDPLARKRIRNHFGISEDIYVIGNIATLSKTKNQVFSVKVVRELLKTGRRAMLMLVGPEHQGYLDSIREEALGASPVVDLIVTGRVDNPEDYYSSFDAFMFPSLFEGSSLAMLEAQANGLESFASSTVPKGSCTSDYMHWISLEEDPPVWAREIEDHLADSLACRRFRPADKNADISRTARKIVSIYDDLREQKRLHSR